MLISGPTDGSTLNSAMSISSSGLTAERFRMDVISGNIANADSESVNGSQPYRRRLVELMATPDGPQVAGIVQDQAPFRTKYDPGNPAADPKTGQVTMTNVQPIEEMVDMIGASRAYEANIAAFDSAKNMVKSALDIGKA